MRQVHWPTLFQSQTQFDVLCARCMYIFICIHIYRTLCVCTRKAKAYIHTHIYLLIHAVTTTLPLASSVSHSWYMHMYMCAYYVTAYVCVTLAVLCQTESVEKERKRSLQIHIKNYVLNSLNYVTLRTYMYFIYTYKFMWCQFFFLSTEHRKQVLIFGLFLRTHRHTKALTQCISRYLRLICVCIRCLPV